MTLVPRCQAAQLEGLTPKDNAAQPEVAAQLGVFTLCLHQFIEGRGGLVENRHPVFHQELEQLRRRLCDPLGHEHQLSAIE